MRSAETDPATPARVPLVAAAGGDPALTAIYERVTATTGGVPMLYQALASAPPQLQGWLDLAWALRSDARSSRAMRELAILRCAHLAGSDYVWRSHVKLAIKEGASAGQVEHVVDWVEHPGLFSGPEQAVLRLADELTGSGSVGDRAWDEAATHFDAEALVEIVLTISWYQHVARVVDTLRIPLEPYHVKVAPVPRSAALAAPDKESPR